LGGSAFQLARDGIVDAMPAFWPAWSFVWLSGARQDLPVLVRAQAGWLKALRRPLRGALRQSWRREC
jgi:hypothetical protein